MFIPTDGSYSLSDTSRKQNDALIIFVSVKARMRREPANYEDNFTTTLRSETNIGSLADWDPLLSYLSLLRLGGLIIKNMRSQYILVLLCIFSLVELDQITLP